jgi:hypothetical protein
VAVLLRDVPLQARPRDGGAAAAMRLASCGCILSVADAAVPVVFLYRPALVTVVLLPQQPRWLLETPSSLLQCGKLAEARIVLQAL